MLPIPLPDTLAAMIRQHCSPEWRDLIRKECVTSSYGPGEDICIEGSAADMLYIVRKGRVKVYSTFRDGSVRIIRFARDGQVVGHRGIGGDFTYTISAKALETTSVDGIPMPLYLNALKANPSFSFHFMLFMAEELRRSEEQTKNHLDLNVQQRVAKAILAAHRCFGIDPDDETLLAYTPSRQDLAAYAGTSYESAIRALSALQRKKLIRSVGRELRILNSFKLEQFLKG
jgi:CRP/FNR family transcriptional regulator